MIKLKDTQEDTTCPNSCEFTMCLRSARLCVGTYIMGESNMFQRRAAVDREVKGIVLLGYTH